MAGRLLRWLWTLSALLVIAYALLVAAGRELLPRLDSLQPRLDTALSERLGSRVEARQLNGDWARLSPHLYAGSVRVAAAPGQEPFLVIDELGAEVDLLRSLRAGQPVWSDLALARLQVRLEETASGWVLDGGAPGAQGAAGQVVDLLLAGRRTHIARIEATLRFRSGTSAMIAANDVLLENGGGFHRAGAALEFAGAEFARAMVEWRGDLDTAGSFWGDTQGRGYLKLSRIDLAGSLGVVLRGLAPDWARRLAPVAVPLDAEIWATATGNGRTELVGHVASDRLPLGTAPGASPLRSLKADLTGWLGADDWGVRLQNLGFDWADRDIAPLTLEFRRYPGANPRFAVAADHLDLGTLNAMVLAADLLPSHAAQVLATLQPTGRLIDPQVDIDLDLPDRIAGYRTGLDNVAVASWKGSPAVRGVSGRIIGSGHGGVLTLAGTSELAMLFPEAYSDYFRVGQVSGEVGFTLDDDYSTLEIQGAPLEIDAADGAGSIRAAFRLHQPLAPGVHGELWLSAGIRASTSAYARQYIPRVLEPELQQWLDRALGEMRVVEGGFIWRGAIEKEAGARRAIEVYARVADGAIAFDPEWPGLTGVNAYVAVDGSEVSGGAEQASIAGVPVRDIRFRTVTVPDNPKSLLAVTANAATEVSRALGVLAQSPLADRIAPLHDWRAEGPVSVALDLRIPLSKQHSGEHYRVAARLADATLSHRTGDLKFERIRGDIRFSEADGLTADGLSARFWGRDITATMRSDPKTGETRIESRGRAAVQDIPLWPDWLRGTVVGETDYAATYLVSGPGKPPQLSVESSLRGVTSRLPEPFAKAEPETPLPATLHLAFDAAGDDLGVQIGTLLAARGHLENGRLARAEIALGGASAELPATPGLSIRGRLDSLDLDAWRKLLPANAGAKDVLDAYAPHVQVRIGTLRAAGLQLDGIAITGGLASHAWHLRGDGPIATGELVIPMGDGPIGLHLDHLALPKPDFASGEGVLAQLDPRTLPDLDFSTQGLRVGERELGQIGFALRRVPEGIEARAIRGEITGLVVGGGESTSTLRWRRLDGHDESRFEGALDSDNLAGVLRAWGSPEAIVSEHAGFVATLEWAGQPWQFSARALRGEVAIRIAKGSFHRTSGAASNAAMKLIGLINFDTWLRRLRLDFSDLFDRGVAFDELKTTLAFNAGILDFVQPVKVQLPSGRMRLDGRADLIAETIDAHLVATLPVGTNLPWIAALAGGLPAAAGVYLTSRVFNHQVDKLSSLGYRVTGSWEEPNVEVEKIFSDSAKSN